ncbi:pupal cuticle protein Edg-84A-like [Palaemon carinicauda]|uniref:pupal cuticle protein Edg-84A-like n=1 Tax=Palaemon carinicauda TaxID=392227 RepID=UPI0035B5D3DB
MKTLVLMCLLGVALCAPQLGERDAALDEESIEPFDFSLAVNDDLNTVYTTRQESQDENGNVQGEYTWVAANGIRYIISYTADAINGFQTQIREEPTDIVVKIPEPQPQFQ